MNDWFWYLNRIGFGESRYFLSIIADFRLSFLPLCTVNYQNTERGDSSPLFLFTDILESKVEKRIREIIEEIIAENQSIFLVDIVVKGNSGNQKANSQRLCRGMGKSPDRSVYVKRRQEPV